MKKTMEAIYSNKDILEVSADLIEDLKARALASPRKRYRLCMHHTNAHPTQEMIIVAHQGTFMPPHRHPGGKSESYHVIEGNMTVCFFDDDGKVVHTIKMGDKASKRPFLQRLSVNKWHMPVPTSEWIVYHETYSGPFEKDHDVEFPSWCPQETDKDKVEVFLASIRKYF